MPAPYAAALLDLYDTLVWTEWSALRDRMVHRLKVEPRELLRAFDRTRPARSVGAYPDAAADMAALLGELHIEDEATIADLVELERSFFAERERVHLHEDSLPAVRELRSRGTKAAIVSNCSHSTRTELERLGLEHEVDAVVLSFEVKSMKPQPEIYRAALEPLDVPATAAVFVDDQARYCDGARDLGIDTRLIVRRGANPPEGFAASTNGHVVIESLQALLD